MASLRTAPRSLDHPAGIFPATLTWCFNHTTLKRSLLRREADVPPPRVVYGSGASDPEGSLQLRRGTGILAFANVNCLAHRAKGLLHVRRFSASGHRYRAAPGRIARRSTARQRIPPDHKRGPIARDGATFANRGSSPPAALPVACGF